MAKEKRVPKKELAKSQEVMKQEKKISGFAVGVTPTQSSSMLKQNLSSTRRVGGILGEGSKQVNKVYRNMGK